VREVLRILISPLVWLASFSAVYALHGFICGTGLSGTIFGLPGARVLLIAAYGSAIALQVALLAVLYASRFASSSNFVRFSSRATGWVGLIATIWSLIPVALTTYCLH
jgi:hypothetical protein